MLLELPTDLVVHELITKLSFVDLLALMATSRSMSFLCVTERVMDMKIAQMSRMDYQTLKETIIAWSRCRRRIELLLDLLDRFIFSLDLYTLQIVHFHRLEENRQDAASKIVHIVASASLSSQTIKLFSDANSWFRQTKKHYKHLKTLITTVRASISRDTIYRQRLILLISRFIREFDIYAFSQCKKSSGSLYAAELLVRALSNEELIEMMTQINLYSQIHKSYPGGLPDLFRNVYYHLYRAGRLNRAILEVRSAALGFSLSGVLPVNTIIQLGIEPVMYGWNVNMIPEEVIRSLCAQDRSSHKENVQQSEDAPFFTLSPERYVEEIEKDNKNRKWLLEHCKSLVIPDAHRMDFSAWAIEVKRLLLEMRTIDL